MSDQHHNRQPHDKLVQALVASSRAERPAEGARGRALDVVVRQLRTGSDSAARAASPRRAWTVALVGLGLAFGLLAGAVFVQHQEETRTLAARAELLRRNAELREEGEGIARVRAELSTAIDPDKIAALQAELTQAQQNAAANAAAAKSALPAAAAAGGSNGAPATKPRSIARPVGAACNCTPGDPLCSCL